jgi:hypothetical protein
MGNRRHPSHGTSRMFETSTTDLDRRWSLSVSHGSHRRLHGIFIRGGRGKHGKRSRHDLGCQKRLTHRLSADRGRSHNSHGVVIFHKTDVSIVACLGVAFLSTSNISALVVLAPKCYTRFAFMRQALHARRAPKGLITAILDHRPESNSYWHMPFHIPVQPNTLLCTSSRPLMSMSERRLKSERDLRKVFSMPRDGKAAPST